MLANLSGKGVGAGGTGGTITIDSLNKNQDASFSNVEIIFSNQKGDEVGTLEGDITACYCSGLDAATIPDGGGGGKGKN